MKFHGNAVLINARNQRAAQLCGRYARSSRTGRNGRVEPGSHDPRRCVRRGIVVWDRRAVTQNGPERAKGTGGSMCDAWRAIARREKTRRASVPLSSRPATRVTRVYGAFNSASLEQDDPASPFTLV